MAILCGTDLSTRGAEAADVAAAMAARGPEPLVLVHAFESGDAEAAKAELAEEARRLQERYPGLPVEPRLEYGLPDEVLVRLAGAGEGESLPDVRLVVISSLGRRRTRWVLGSVAERTAQSSPVPVLVVREAGALRLWLSGERRLRVMVGFDFGDESEAALRWAAALGHVAPCDTIVVHVAAPSAPAIASRRPRRSTASSGPDDLEVRLLAELRSRVGPHAWADPPRVWVVLAPGKRAPIMARLADEEGADLVVLGSRLRHGPGLLWQESVSRGVLYHAAMSVACVPLAGAAEAGALPETAPAAADADLVAKLEAHAFLHGVPGDLLQRLATIAREETRPAGSLVLREGEEADRLLLIRRGVVALEIGMPGKAAIRLETLVGGDILGLSWLNPPYRWQFDARAVEPVEALALDASRLREWMREDPRMGQAVATRLVAHLQQRLERVRLQRLDVYGAEA